VSTALDVIDVDTPRAIEPPGRQRPGGSARPPLSLLVPGTIVALASLAPVAYLVLREGFDLAQLRRQLEAPSTMPLLGHTITLALGVTVASVVLGVGLAVLVARTTLPFPRLWTVLFTLPLGVPAFVGAYAWVAMNNRYLPTSTHIYGRNGAIGILSLMLFPYVFLPVLTALRNLDPAQEEVARSLGWSAPATFLRVTLPHLRAPIAGGALIISLHMVAEYGALQLLRYQTLTTAIVQRATVLGAPEAARALAVVLAVLALGFLGLERLVRGQARPVRSGGGAARPPTRWSLGWATPLWLAASGALVVAALGVPVAATVLGLVDRGSGAASVDWSLLWASAANTARFGFGAALLATVVALPISLLTTRHPGRLSAALERSTWVAHALPGVILALALVYLSVRWAYPLYQTTPLLIIAYVVLYLPLALAGQQVGLGQASRSFEDVSRSLGLGPLRTFARVTLPLALPAIATGALLVALDVGKELTTTLLLRPTGKDTLATALWTTTNGEVLDFTAAAPYGLVLLLVGAVPAAFLARRALRD
jgi:iron(III) transport system permease protein